MLYFRENKNYCNSLLLYIILFNEIYLMVDFNFQCSTDVACISLGLSLDNVIVGSEYFIIKTVQDSRFTRILIL